MSGTDRELEYVNLAPEHAEALEELELSVFSTIDPEDLYHAEELARLATVFPEGNFVVLDDGRPIGMGLGILVDFDFAHTQHALADITGADGVSNHDAHSPWYYGTDISVYPEYRGRGIGRRLYELRKACVRSLDKKGIVAGACSPVMPPTSTRCRPRSTSTEWWPVSSTTPRSRSNSRTASRRWA